ncbi:MAG: RluA family pseudouridine synthase [Clostridia bacterium]|nr:RluA family pseudouridine synthase [Clostridia bacterium]
MKPDLETFIVKKEEVNQRIDSYLAKQKEELSRVTIQRLIEEEKILVNGKKTKASYKIQEKDEITVEEEKPKEIELKAQDIPIEIIYEDSDIIVVNKPKGMVVHPANGNPDGTLVNAIMAICKDSLSGIGGEIRPGIVHRIDKDTSGILIVAKNDKAHINLSEQIKNHEVKKTYIALVRGMVKENEATIHMPIGRSTKDRKKMAVTQKGKEAITHFKVIERFSKHNCTLLEVKIETGRTHQIRVHLAQIGYPIIGDTTYSNGKNQWGIQGQCLHAKSLQFQHPSNKKEMFLEARLPEYFQEVLIQLQEE